MLIVILSHALDQLFKKHEKTSAKKSHSRVCAYKSAKKCLKYFIEIFWHNKINELRNNFFTNNAYSSIIWKSFHLLFNLSLTAALLFHFLVKKLRTNKEKSLWENFQRIFCWRDWYWLFCSIFFFFFSS